MYVWLLVRQYLALVEYKDVRNWLDGMAWGLWHHVKSSIVGEGIFDTSKVRIFDSICVFNTILVYIGPLHTQNQEPVTIAIQSLSLVEKVESVQVRFTLHLRDQRSTWMQDGCKVYTWHQMDRVSWSLGPFCQNHLLEVGLTQIQKTMALDKLKKERWYILFYDAWEPARIKKPSLK